MKFRFNFENRFDAMKRFLLLALLAAGMTQLAPAQSSTFHWVGTLNYPPDSFPGSGGVIDATNFWNEGVFNITVPADNLNLDSLYFQTSSTLNYTNTGSMFGNAGFIFDFDPSYFVPPKPGVPFNKMAANFVNQRNGFTGGDITCSAFASSFFSTNALLFGRAFSGKAKFIATATNIVNSGSILVDASSINSIVFGRSNIFNVPPIPGLINLTGENIDLRGGSLALTSSGANSNFFGLFNTFFGFGGASLGVSSFDYGTGTDTNRDWIPGIDLQQSTARSSFFQTVRGSAFFMNLSNSIPYSSSTQLDPSNVLTSSIFLQDTSPNVTNRVFFNVNNSGFFGLDDGLIEWSGLFIDPATGTQMTNYLYLQDFFFAVTTNIFIFNGVPENYSFIQGTTQLGGLPAAKTPNLPVFGLASVTNFYSYLNAELVPTSVGTNEIYRGVFGGAITNLPQRIHISASRTLKLDDARISGADYMELKSTNQFEGNVGAAINVPFSDISLGVTNGFLSISNLVPPVIPRWRGTIEAFTGRWIEVDVNGITNNNSALLVNSHLFPTTAPQIQDLILHATNSLVISDPLSISRKLSIDATHLTLTTNSPGAMSPVGQLNFISQSIVWSDSMPRLKYLTNSGVITAPNQMFFAGNILSPYYDQNAATPYEAFVNHGTVTNQGSFIVAKYFVNDGIFQGRNNGNFTLIAGCAYLTNGAIKAPTGAGDISISANNLVISNHTLQAGGRLSIAVSNCYSDGFSLFNMFGHVVTTNTPPFGIVSNGNFWALSGSFSMLAKPTTGDLLGTTISNSVPSFAINPLITWAGKDRGCAPTGYVNNLAVGRLILNGGTGSKINFTGANTGNALYVDRLELMGSATNLGPVGLTNILIGSNMRIYYAQAIANGASIAEKLSGRNGGRFCWVSNYAGVFSSTNITVNFTNYTYNQALVESQNIDSDGDGLVNAFDPSPIPLNWVFDNVVSNAPCTCDLPVVPGSSSGGVLHSGHQGGSDSTVLQFPDDGAHDSTGSTSNLLSLGKRKYNFNGLFYDTNGVTTASAGYFKAYLDKNSLITGNLKLAGRAYPFAGKFDTNGHLAKVNLKAGKNWPWLNLDLQLELPESARIHGAVTSSNWTALLMADRLATNAVDGKYTFVLPGDDVSSSNSPAGHGVGTVWVKSDGTVHWSGALGDGTSIPETQLSGLSSQGVWPLYYTPYGGAGLVLGWMKFDASQSDSDLSGDAVWIKPGSLTGKPALLYPAGFTNQLGVIGSAYVQPPVTTSNGAVVLSGGNLPGTETNSFALNSNFKVNKQGANQFYLGITKQSGTFQGGEITGFNPRTRFQGVLLQKRAEGFGFFLGTNRTGQVWYEPLP